MSIKSSGMLADYLDNRWYTSNSTVGAAMSMTMPAPQSANSRAYLDQLYLSFASKGGVNITVTGTLRDASASGTVIAQYPMILGLSQTVQVAPTNMGVPATRGKGFFFATDTAQATVTVTLNASGWFNENAN